MNTKPPKTLSVEARKWWRKYLETYDLDDAALMVLESALESFDRMRQAQALIRTEGIVLTDRFGQKKTHPAVVIERDAKAGMVRQIQALNLDLEPINAAIGRPAGS